MKRFANLEEISDGKLYQTRDMVKADCLGCKNCSKCCHGMGDTITLDPYDIWRFRKGLHKELRDFLEEGSVALGVVDGVILPHMAMVGEEERCFFLTDEGWCGIHPWRSGLCRLFPLGRCYEGDRLQYFVQRGECEQPKVKVKVEKWLDTPQLQQYEGFLLEWRNILNQTIEQFGRLEDIELQREWNLRFLNCFFATLYEGEADFYEQFAQRRTLWNSWIEQEHKATEE